MRGMNRKLAIALVLLISLGYPAKSGAVEFAPPVSYPVGTNPSAVVVGDFNGDGKPDIAVANSGSDNVSILLGNGDGTFQPAVNFDAGLSPNSIASGDFNGDGKPDVAVLQRGDPANNVAGAVSILLGNGNGTFQPPKPLTLTALSFQIAVADFNSDKHADLAVSNVALNTGDVTMSIFLGKGDGTFQSAKTFPMPLGADGAFAVADFNNDTKPDFAIGGTGGMPIFLGKGDGTFQLGPAAPTVENFKVLSVQAGDVNGDGKVDLVVVSVEISNCRELPLFCFPVQRLSGFFGNGDGTFQGEHIIASGTTEVAVGDFNGDGKVDMAYRRIFGTIFHRASSLEIVLGKGNGSFSSPIVMSDLGRGLAADSLNSDKLSDLLAVGTSNDVAVLLNTSPTSGADLGIIQSGASPARLAAGDNLTYSASVLNEGPQDATGVTLTDTLPDSVNFVSATATQGSCVQSHGIVSCTLGSLGDVAEAQITIVATPNAVGTITNSMNVTATEPDLVSANNTATQSSTVLPVYTLTVTKSGSGSGSVDATPGRSGPIDCGTTCSATYLGGSQVNVGENPDPNSFLESWGGACSGSGSCSVTMDGDKTINAKFSLLPKLSVTLAGNGTGSVTSIDGAINCATTGGTCSAFFSPPGVSVPLTATPSGSSSFASWSGACTGTDPNRCSVLLNSDQSVTATFNTPPDFTMSPAATSLTVKRGGQVSDVLTFGAQGGFSGTISLACSVSGPVPMPTCSISPNSVTPGGSATLAVNASALTAGLTPPPSERANRLYAAWLPLPGLILLGIGFGFGKSKKERRTLWLVCSLALAFVAMQVGCAGGSSTNGPPPQTNTITVTATSGALQHSTQVIVTVN